MTQPATVAQKDLGPAGVKKPAGLKAAKRTFKQRIADGFKATPGPVKAAAVAGTGVLVLFGLPALIPVGVGAAAVGGYYAYKKRKYSMCMTPERIKVYEHAIATLKDSKKIRILADEFEKAGCLKEAAHLRKRAALRDRTPAEKKADQARYRKAMADTDCKRIELEVAYFESLGADGSAKNLRSRLAALKCVQVKK